MDFKYREMQTIKRKQRTTESQLKKKTQRIFKNSDTILKIIAYKRL